jgi:hypothetical protein
MSVVVEWDDPDQRILRWHLTGDWNRDEMRIARTLAEMMIARVQHMVHFMVCFSPETRLHTDNLSEIIFLTQPESFNRGWVVFVDARLKFQGMMSFFMSLFPNAGQRVAFTDSEAKARRLFSVNLCAENSLLSTSARAEQA